RANWTSVDVVGSVGGEGMPPLQGVIVSPGYYNSGSVQITAITDGTSNTILFGEFSNFDPNWPQYASSQGSPANYPLCLAARSSIWTTPAYGYLAASGYYPLNLTLPLPVDTSGTWIARFAAYGSGHTQGANFVFCDGSV